MRNIFLSLIGFSLVVPLARGEVLSCYKHLRCSVCELMSRELRKRVPIVMGRTYQTTHRLSSENKISRTGMKGSELAVIEILSSLCENLGNCTLKYCPKRNHRVFSSDPQLNAATVYTPDDRNAIGSLRETGCKIICEEILEMHEDEISDFISQENPERRGFCEFLGICGGQAVEDHVHLERERRKEAFNRRKSSLEEL
mmetsp:Transcript_24330/g.37896  ORF Transcript_24330/g.37896 Transcript_24330/m.37896 type:complete len:199 (-) Transcript_24330:67-663(-)